MSESIDAVDLRALDAEIHICVMGHPAECRLVGDGETLETALHCEPANAAWRVKSDADQYWDRWSPDGAERIVIAPRYTTDLAAAMQVVEKFIDMGGRVSLRGMRFAVDGLADDYKPGWRVNFYLFRRDVPPGTKFSFDTEEESLPLAICRAALAAIASWHEPIGLDHVCTTSSGA